MGEEEEKKTSGGEKKMEEEEEEKKKKPNNKEEEKPKKEDGGGEAKKPAEKESKDGKDSKEESPPPPPPPPPPQEIVLRVYMHCEGCARKVRRCLKGFDGVEDVTTDCRTSKVVVKGEKADPVKVVERVQRKSHRQVELISPIPKPPSPEEEEKKPDAEEKPKPQDKKEEPQVITVVLKVYMHCEACAMEIKKRILKMKGVESAEPDLKTSEVAVKGVFDPPKLVDYVYKRTGKKAVIVKQEPEKKKEDEEGDKGKGKEPSKDEEKKKKGEEEEGGKDKKEQEGDNKTKEKKEGEGEDGASMETTTVVELKRSEYQYYPQRNPSLEMMYYAYPPQIFSDENPNACTVM